MMGQTITGRVHSFQSLGTLDGPGVRFVAFLQGCPLRCGCCHNPDTWDVSGGSEYTAQDVVNRALRCRSYFGSEGGLTLSGGEPLLQQDFAAEVFRLCHESGVNTCLDTSGCIAPELCGPVLQETDRVLLDIKYTSEEMYLQHVGCSLEKPLRFLEALQLKQIPVTLRQVIIPGLNDNEENTAALLAIAKAHPCVDKVELLPFRKICQTKYDMMKIPFPFGGIPEPEQQKMELLRKLLEGYGG
ncbi:MAG: pyruvate formate lyase-activating protein [Clostridiales bacterium]|nr:pyruvate formate lyase-activating protein [Clostridiales bacterium]